MKEMKQKYEAPMVELITACVEKGFGPSQGVSPQPEPGQDPGREAGQLTDNGEHNNMFT